MGIHILCSRERETVKRRMDGESIIRHTSLSIGFVFTVATLTSYTLSEWDLTPSDSVTARQSLRYLSKKAYLNIFRFFHTFFLLSAIFRQGCDSELNSDKRFKFFGKFCMGFGIFKCIEIRFFA